MIRKWNYTFLSANLRGEHVDMDVMHPSSFRETKSESQLLNLLLVGNI